MVALILRHDFDAMPLAVVDRMVRVVIDAVLIAKLRGNFVKDRVYFTSTVVRPGRGQQPSLATACVREGIQDVHIHAV